MTDNPVVVDAGLAARRKRIERRTVRGRLIAVGLGLLAGVLQRLPDRLLHRLGHTTGKLLYAAMPARRRLVRGNLQRVCAHLVARDMALPKVARAAHSGSDLDALTREAFGHWVRSYLEGAIGPIYTRPGMLARTAPDDPGAPAEALGAVGAGKAAIIVGLHFGAMEVPAQWALAKLGIRLTAPMETVSDPDLQAYFERTRSAGGLRIIPTHGAGRELVAALARSEAVALVADRVVAGAGASVELFGAPARLPVGPAALAVETGVPAWLVAARRTGWGTYRTRIERIPLADEGSRRQRVRAFLDAQARAYERAIAQAPEQWWAIFFPIWEDGA
jgi:phosphatidylinositol dimannoside acyltransferase